MDIQDRVSLIDLSKQLPFEIDDVMKEKICFGETLIISCGHYEGDLHDEEENSESDWTCEDSSEPTVSEEEKHEPLYEIKDYVAEETVQEEEEEEVDDFCFYFFPDCDKPPPPQNSKTSFILVDGLPKLNLAAKKQEFCVCKKNKAGECPCYLKTPCKCGAKTQLECTCSQIKDICVCFPGPPAIACKCNKKADVCICDPHGKMFPICTCALIEKPCICQKGKFPSPICTCKHKPKLETPCLCFPGKFHPVCKCVYDEAFEDDTREEAREEAKEEAKEEASICEGNVEEESVGKPCKVEAKEEPCTCQKPEPKKQCTCLKGKPCTCLTECICGAQRVCQCEPEECEKNNILAPCKHDDNKSICSCDAPKVCTCEKTGTICKCFPAEICTCGNPENCKCFTTCDCTNPCICDTLPAKTDECICLNPPKKTDITGACLCIEEPRKKLKRSRVRKDGYRWCNDTDPRHTYFNYAYGQHDKLVDEVETPKKFEILGLHDDKEPDVPVCPIHGLKIPKYEKKPRKPSLDCCSAVGGISICVESLGEGKDKLLVQVVSYSSKEGAKTGSKLVSILDCNLHTMEENRVEHVTKHEITKERRSYAAICESGYYNKVTRICGDKHVVKRFYHSFEQAHNFMLEGANIVLLRYIALQRYKGTIQTDTVMMDGTICRSIYVCKGVSQGVVNGTPFFVVKVERHIIEPSGYIHQTLTVLSLKGYTISHEWADNCYIFHVNPLLRVDPSKDEIEPHEPLQETWRNDLQLMSDFLDFKSTRESQGGRYVTESGTLSSTVRDYLQAILLLRPQDTLHFTRHYFGTVLSALDLPHDEFFDPTSKHVRYYFFEE